MQILDRLAYKVLRKKSNEEIKKLFNIKCGCKPQIKEKEIKVKTLQATAKIDRYDMRTLKDYKATIKKEMAYDLVDNLANILDLEVLEDNNTYRIYKGILKYVGK